LRGELAEYQARLEQQQRDAVDRETRHTSEIMQLNARLEPFIRTAAAKYPGVNVDQALERLRHELDDVRALASPPLLSIRSKDVQKRSDGGVILSVQFARSKDSAIGKIAVRFAIVDGGGGTARIQAIEPMGIAIGLRRAVASDGATATIEYSVPPGEDPGVRVVLSGPTRLTVEGNNGLQSAVLAAQ
jgi:hypothetical protein